MSIERTERGAYYGLDDDPRWVGLLARWSAQSSSAEKTWKPAERPISVLSDPYFSGLIQSILGRGLKP